MSTLILPICGESTRYPDMPPKWSIEHNGQIMLEHSIKGIPLDYFDEILVIGLRKHYAIHKTIKFKHNLVLLDKQTNSQTETVFKGLSKENISGSIVIKDCDNRFDIVPEPGNFVAYHQLSGNIHNAENKSYIEINQLGLISNIVEKTVISNDFCCGMYGFEDAKEFCSVYSQYSDKIKFISDLIFVLLLQRKIFKPIKATNYYDWGTLEDWNYYIGEINEV